MQLGMEQEDEKIHSSFILFYIVWIFKNLGQGIFTITVKCFCYKVFCSPSAYWALALSCRNYLFFPLNPFLHEKQSKRIIFQYAVKVCSCPLSLPALEPAEISQIGLEKEADDSAFRARKHMSYSIHQHINRHLYIHLRLCLLLAGEPWASDLISQPSLSIKWGNVTVSLVGLWRRLNETLDLQVIRLAGASCYLPRHKEGFPGSSDSKEVKRLPTMRETLVWSLGREDPLEKGMAAHSSILAWRIPWTEEPGGLQSMGSQSRASPIPHGNSEFQHGCQWVPALWPTHKTHPHPGSEFHQLKIEGTKEWSVKVPCGTHIL